MSDKNKISIIFEAIGIDKIISSTKNLLSSFSSFGKTVESISKKTLSFGEEINKLSSLSLNVGKSFNEIKNQLNQFGDSSKKAIASITGQTDSLKDLGKVLTGQKDVYKVFEGMRNQLDTLADSLKKAGDGANEQKTAIDILVSAITNQKGAYDSLINDTLSNGQNKIKDIVTLNGLFKDSLGNIQTEIDVFANSLDKSSDSVDKQNSSLRDLIKVLSEQKDSYNSLINDALSNGEVKINDIINVNNVYKQTLEDLKNKYGDISTSSIEYQRVQQEIVNSGTILETVNKTLKKSIDDGATSFDNISKIIRDTSSSLNNIQNDISNSSSAFDNIKNKVMAFVNSNDNLKNGFTSLTAGFGSVNKAASDIANGFKNAGTSISEKLTLISDNLNISEIAMKGVSVISDTLGNAISKASNFVADLASNFIKAHPQLSAVAGTLANVASQAINAGKTFGSNLVSGLKTAGEAFDKVKVVGSGALKAINSAFGPVGIAIDLVSKAIDHFKKIFGDIEKLTGSNKGLAEDFQKAQKAITDISDMVTKVLGALVGPALKTFGDIMEKVSGVFKDTSMIDKFANGIGAVQAAVSLLWDGFSYLVGELKGAFTPVISGIIDVLSSVNEKFAVVQNVIGGVVNAWSYLVDIMKGGMQVITSLLKGDIGGAFDAFKSTVKDAALGLPAIFTNAGKTGAEVMDAFDERQKKCTQESRDNLNATTAEVVKTEGDGFQARLKELQGFYDTEAKLISLSIVDETARNEAIEANSKKMYEEKLKLLEDVARTQIKAGGDINSISIAGIGNLGEAIKSTMGQIEAVTNGAISKSLDSINKKADAEKSITSLLFSNEKDKTAEMLRINKKASEDKLKVLEELYIKETAAGKDATKIQIEGYDNLEDAIKKVKEEVENAGEGQESTLDELKKKSGEIVSGLGGIASSIGSMIQSTKKVQLESLAEYDTAIQRSKDAQIEALKKFDDEWKASQEEKQNIANAMAEEEGNAYTEQLESEMQRSLEAGDILSANAIQNKLNELEAEKNKKDAEKTLAEKKKTDEDKKSKEREKIEKETNFAIATAEYNKALAEHGNKVKLAEMEASKAKADAGIGMAQGIAAAAIGVATSVAQLGPIAGLALGLTTAATIIGSVVSGADAIKSAAGNVESVKGSPPTPPKFAHGTAGYSLKQGEEAVVGEAGAEVVKNKGGLLEVQSTEATKREGAGSTIIEAINIYVSEMINREKVEEVVNSMNARSVNYAV